MGARWIREFPVVLLLAAIVFFRGMPHCAEAATYKLPVRTATLAVESDHYGQFVNGLPVGPYDFQIDPTVLRVGEDHVTGWSYDSMAIFDWSELHVISEGTHVQMALYLSLFSPPAGYAGGYWTELSAGHSVPNPSDFDWGGGGFFTVFDFGFSGIQPAALPLGGYPYTAVHHQDYGYTAIPLYSAYPVFEIAGVNNGLGLEAPYILVTTVPEPSSLIALGAEVLLLGAIIAGARKRRLMWQTTFAVLGLFVVLVGQAVAQDEGSEMNSEPGSAGTSLSGAPMPGTRDLPDDFKVLPAFPRLFWSFGCAPTAGAMIVGYYDNAGFPRMFRNPDGSDAVFPTTNYPSDNKLFLRKDGNGNLLDSVYMYPSRCAVSATEMGVFGQVGYGNVDDYYYGSPFADLTGIQWGSALDPYYPSRSPHTDNCIADYMGASHWQWRRQSDGSTYFWEVRTTSPQVPWGVPHRWTPEWASNGIGVYPIPYSGSWTYVDGTWGLAQYISQYAGYQCKTTSWIYNSTAYQYEDIADFYNLSIAGYRSEAGATPQDVVDEIDAGRPVMVLMHELNSSGVETYSGHVFPIFGYKWTTENGQQRLKMLAYDTWFEDKNSGSELSYRVVDFPNADEIPFNGIPPNGTAATGYFTRASSSKQYKIYESAFLRINNNDRCPLPLGTNDYPSGAYADEFDIDFDLPAGNSRVHYSGRAPTPGSPAVTLDANGDGTLHIDKDSMLSFRTYRDATPPDGYLASDVVRRVYSVFSSNKNIKKFADDTEVTMVNGIVTHVLDSDSFYFEERDTRLFGIRVDKEDHGLATGDEVEVVVGSIGTDASNDERYIEATTVTETSPATKVIAPYCMTNISLGGKDYLPPGGWGAGYGQKGVVNSTNLNNVGLLVRTCGIVTHVDTDWFTISDGSGAVDSEDNDGVKVYASGFIPQGLAVDDFAAATGVCSLEKDGDDRYPIIIARDSDDLAVVQ